MDNTENHSGYFQNKENMRNGNIEMLRVISMLQILILHYLLLGGVLNSITRNNGLHYYLAWILEAFSLGAVNVFVLISGYYLSSKTSIKSVKIINIILQCIFYSITIYLIGCLFKIVPFYFPTLITAYVLPLISGKWWFVGCYIVLYLFAPYLNILHNNLNEKQHLRLVMIGTIIFSFIPSIIFWAGNTIGVNAGYSLIWFIFLYLLAAYIQKYNKNWSSKIPWFCIYVMMCLITFGSKILQEIIIGKSYWYWYEYTSLTVLIGALSLFMFFKNGGENNNINTKIDSIFRFLGRGTLGVYLIHTHFVPYKEFLWNKLVQADKEWASHGAFHCLVHLFISVIVIFIICEFIDFIRACLFSLFKKYLIRKEINY